MDTYHLKDKLSATKDFVDDLMTKSWQEIEHLQNQLANIEVNQENSKLIQLFKNLLTSYYVFVGGLENLSGTPVPAFDTLVDDVEAAQVTPAKVALSTNIELNDLSQPDSNAIKTDFEPFEYFTDFDEPFGDPITDEDLYN